MCCDKLMRPVCTLFTALCADRRLPGKLVGTIAVMLHERSTALQRLASMSPEKPDHLLDPPLWVLPQTPQGWPCQRVAFFWWTATHSSFRRCDCSSGAGVLMLMQPHWPLYNRAWARDSDTGCSVRLLSACTMHA